MTDISVERTSKTVAVVVRALSILTELSGSHQGMTLQQIQRALGLPVATVHRLLRTLTAEGFVVRSEKTKRYSLGPVAHRLGSRSLPSAQLVQPPGPLSELAAATGETAFITQMLETRIVCVSLVESIHHLRLFVRIGQEMPLHAAASARSILAYREPALVEALLSLHPREQYTLGTPRDLNPVLDQLADVRRQGYDVCDGELDDGVWAVSAPIFDVDSHVNYGVTVAAAGSRVTSQERRGELVAHVRRAAEDLSAILGHPVGFGANS